MNEEQSKILGHAVGRDQENNHVIHVRIDGSTTVRELDEMINDYLVGRNIFDYQYTGMRIGTDDITVTYRYEKSLSSYRNAGAQAK